MPAFPVDLINYLGDVWVEQQAFDLMEGLSVQNITGGGEVLRSGGSARLWHGTLTFGTHYQSGSRALLAKLNTVRAAGASFYIGDMTVPLTPASTATINSTNFAGAGDSVTLAGLPNAFVVEPGSYIHWEIFGRRYLHQVVVGRTANASGVTAGIEITPRANTTIPVGHPVYVGRAKCRAVIVPGTFQVGGSRGVIHEGISFDWTQTLRENP